MENYALVRPEHLNHYGHLFGGVLLKWVDEFAWMAASREYTGCRLVTIGMDRVEFKQPAPSGSILRFLVQRGREGTTSVTYSVEVFADEPGASEEKSMFTTNVTFVRVDEEGEKVALAK